MTKEESEKPSYGHSATHPIRNAVTVFVDGMHGLKEVMPLLETTAKQAEEDAREMRREAVKRLEPDLPALEDLIKGQPERRRLDRAHRNDILIPSVAAAGLLNAQRDLGSAIVLMMVAHFDHFVSDMIWAAFEVQPDLRRSLRREIAFSDLAGMEDIAEVARLVIEKEIEDTLHRNREGQLKWFYKHCGMKPLDKGLAAALADVAELRNLIAHHGGVVTNRIGAMLRNRKDGLLVRYEAGEEISIHQGQIVEIHEILIAAAVGISQGVWRKLRSDEHNAADRLFHELTYTRLALNEIQLAQRLLHLGKAHHSTMGESCRLIKTVNLAQSYKWLDDQKGCLNILNSEDWSRHEPPFQLAAAVLREEWNEAEQLMMHCASEDLLDKAEFEDWPVFRQFRETSHFKRAFGSAYD